MPPEAPGALLRARAACRRVSAGTRRFQASRVKPGLVSADTRDVKVVHLTTSYPRHAEDYAGRFIADVVGGLQGYGVEVEVLAPGAYRDYGLAYGGGVVHNLRRRPWMAPLMLLSMLRTLRRAAKGADLVHAHWLAAGLVAAFAGRPFVITLQGSGSAGRFADLELARSAPWLVGFVLRRARVVICVSEVLAEAARRCGARDVRVIPNGVPIPVQVGVEAEPAEVLYAGRLSPEKGVAVLVEATEGLNLVVAGDGPLRSLVPGALGLLPHAALDVLYARAAVVVLPSYSEGLPLAVVEAMAHGRPVVASAVGGIPDLVVDGETGFLVPPGDAVALRAAIEKLLADSALRKRMGAAGRERIIELCSLDRVTQATLAAYGPDRIAA
jgi:glycosyltransferase involved in cell wall biosynthesis